MQTIDELTQLLQQRTWDKELVVWFGPESKLLPALTRVQVETLDLLDLFTTWSGLSETGMGVSEIRPHVNEAGMGGSEIRPHVNEAGMGVSEIRPHVNEAGMAVSEIRPHVNETGMGGSEIRPHVWPVSQLTDDDDIRQYLTRSLCKWLQSLDRPAGKRTVLLVRSAALLARYRVGVRDFYEWFCDDFSMVILLVERPAAEEQWPEEVECNPNRMVEYFSENDMTKRQFQS